MASYLARLIERASGETAPENRVDAIMPAPEPVDSAAAAFDPFEDAAEDDVQLTSSSEPIVDSRDPLPQPDAQPERPSPIPAETPESVISEGAPLPAPIPSVQPVIDMPLSEDDVSDGMAERIVIERWHEDGDSVVDLPPPKPVEREVIFERAAEAEDDEPAAALPPPAPAESFVPPRDELTGSPFALEPPPVHIGFSPDVDLDPPAAPPVDGLSGADDLGPSITIGDVVVEIVATKRQPDPVRRQAAPVVRAPERSAPRPGVRSKRRYGIGQS